MIFKNGSGRNQDQAIYLKNLDKNGKPFFSLIKTLARTIRVLTSSAKYFRQTPRTIFNRAYFCIIVTKARK